MEDCNDRGHYYEPMASSIIVLFFTAAGPICLFVQKSSLARVLSTLPVTEDTNFG